VSGAPSSEPTTARLEAFSDGVLAIAITLLILEVRPPTVEEGLARALLDQWPRYVSYVVSFLTVGIVWVNHHALFARINRVTRPLLFLNLLLLMAVSFLPFPTALLGEYLAAGHEQGTAAAVYSLNLGAINLAFAVMWVYLIRRPDLVEAAWRAHLNRSLARSAVGLAGYGAAAGLALLGHAALAVAVCALVAGYFVFPARAAAPAVQMPDRHQRSGVAGS